MKVLYKNCIYGYLLIYSNFFLVTGVLITLVCLENPPVMRALLRMNVLVPYSVIQQVIYVLATIRKNFKRIYIVRTKFTSKNYQSF